MRFRYRKHLFSKATGVQLPTGWEGLTLGQYNALRTRLPECTTADRLRWQVVICSGSSWQQLRPIPDAHLRRWASQALGFLQQPIVPAQEWKATLPGGTYHLPTELGTLPLAAWVVLERHWLLQPERLQALQQGQWQAVADLLATVVVPHPSGWNDTQLPTVAQHLQQLPVPVAAYGLAHVLAQVARLQHTYPELFPQPEPHEPTEEPTEEPAEAPATLNPYWQRWGWNALLAELAQHRLTPSTRQEWLAAPIHVVFQELARRESHYRLFPPPRE
jgi:hypothetical protein